MHKEKSKTVRYKVTRDDLDNLYSNCKTAEEKIALAESSIKILDDEHDIQESPTDKT